MELVCFNRDIFTLHVIVNLRCAESNAALAAFHSAGQLFHAARFQADVFPALVQGFFHFVGYVDDLRRGDDIVPPMDEAIEHLIEPETVFSFAILVEIADFASV
jgi:hypothetical protein